MIQLLIQESGDPSDWIGRLFSWVIFGAVFILPIARSVIESLGLGKKKGAQDEDPAQPVPASLDVPVQAQDSPPAVLDIIRAARVRLQGERPLVSAEPAAKKPKVKSRKMLRKPLRAASDSLGEGAHGNTALSNFGTEAERDLAWPTLVASTLGSAERSSENALEARGQEVSRRVDLTPSEVPVVDKRSSRWTGQDWRRAIVAREVLGPPRALKDHEPF